jgi:hypothetical protein
MMNKKMASEIEAMLVAAKDDANASLSDWQSVKEAPSSFVRAAQSRANTAQRRLERFRNEVVYDPGWPEPRR